MPSASYPVTTFNESVAISFVIPSEAEGSAVQRIRLGNVSKSSLWFLWRFCRLCAGKNILERLALFLK